ncbi:MAG: LamG domain-containing protein [Chloroflexi bacterium]|nr:LamG domain-containing protein [Chloroflexota bacterium]
MRLSVPPHAPPLHATISTAMPAPTPALLGYADRFSVEAGDTLRFMVSCESARFNASLVRLIHGDANPAGPGYRAEPVPSTADGTHPGKRQVIAAGSYVRIPGAGGLDLTRGLTVQAWIWPTTPAHRSGQTVVAAWSASEQRGFAFGLDATGRPVLELGCGAEVRRVIHAGEPLDPWRWAFLAATYDARSGLVRLYQASAEPYRAQHLLRHDEQLTPGWAICLPVGDLLLAARQLDAQRRPTAAFNGKIDRPKLFDRALNSPDVERLRRLDEPLPARAVAAWDFSVGIGDDTVHDASASALHGVTVNMPTRAVTDHTWSGAELRWTAAPEQYAAIHFHDDDLEDAGWQPSLELVVSESLRSGVYALRLDAEQAEEYVPFFVRPKAGRPTAPIAFLAPTFTYMAYANERLYWNEGYREKRPRLTPLQTEPPDIDRYMAEHRELGLSLYDLHSDGSGCAYSSRLRPILNMRPNYRAWRLQDAPRHFAADLYLIGWLEAHGFTYDVITDEDLHRAGRELLAPYQVVLTGSHPEYVTAAMHTAVEQYLEHGGRLMYLGGNGFYWVTSLDPRRPHLIELRRGTTGTRAWESLPGESYHSMTGEPGGLWRLRGKAPQRLVGVGFAAQGWGGAAGYARLPASRDPQAAFIFEGIGDDEVIGDFGLVLGGAAGDEIDRYDMRLGSPPHALLLATSAGKHTDYYQVTAEDVPVMIPGQGGTESPKVRADMVFFETPHNGAVFSVGSINWLGSLGSNGYANNVARLTENVLRRFLDPTPWSPQPVSSPGRAAQPTP